MRFLPHGARQVAINIESLWNHHHPAPVVTAIAAATVVVSATVASRPEAADDAVFNALFSRSAHFVPPFGWRCGPVLPIFPLVIFAANAETNSTSWMADNRRGGRIDRALFTMSSSKNLSISSPSSGISIATPYAKNKWLPKKSDRERFYNTLHWCDIGNPLPNHGLEEDFQEGELDLIEEIEDPTLNADDADKELGEDGAAMWGNANGYANVTPAAKHLHYDGHKLQVQLMNAFDHCVSRVKRMNILLRSPSSIDRPVCWTHKLAVSHNLLWSAAFSWLSPLSVETLSFHTDIIRKLKRKKMTFNPSLHNVAYLQHIFKFICQKLFSRKIPLSNAELEEIANTLHLSESEDDFEDLSDDDSDYIPDTSEEDIDIDSEHVVGAEEMDEPVEEQDIVEDEDGNQNLDRNIRARKKPTKEVIRWNKKTFAH
ncbi:hypothetical protein NQ317_017187 [Molorchus minor]|uniref:Uncharacterized protein n=1 Tax=Molorchus minor TaxID=1323400 RepID=A0ABQ9J0Y9_9CUCU|nr:hypothetical protein NQ317_017187 [Molorchus minor]